MTYLLLSVLTGALGGLRALTFSLVGRRTMVSVRTRLFKSILHQDIAFFDGFKVGDLTQRLGGDVRAMSESNGPRTRAPCPRRALIHALRLRPAEGCPFESCCAQASVEAALPRWRVSGMAQRARHRADEGAPFE